MSPKVGSVVTLPEGRGVVTESNILTGKVKVRLEDNPDNSVVETTRDILNGVVPEKEEVAAPATPAPVEEKPKQEKPQPPHKAQNNKPQGDKPQGDKPQGRPHHHRRGHQHRNKRQG